MTNARDLATRLAELLAREHAALADFLVALADFDRRRLWRDLGYAGLFDFLHRELGLSKGAAHFRKVAAQLVQRFPEIVEPLRDGRLCITSIVELAKVLTLENRDEVLPRFFHRSKREAKAIAVEIQPAEVVPRREVVTAMRPVPSGAPAPRETTPSAGPGSGAPTASADPQPAPVLLAELAHANSRTRPQQGRMIADPLTADLSRLHVTVSRRFLEKLEVARAALSHSHPGASSEEILEAGLDLVIERHAKRRGLVAGPRARSRPAKPDRVAARDSRQVRIRDGGRCQWPLASGGICGSTVRVQVDHVIARGRGGPSTAGNLRLLCASHNDEAARQEFGDGWMDRFT